MTPSPANQSAWSAVRRLAATTLAIAATVAATAAVAEQGPVQAAGSNRVDAREARQDARIDQGVRTGSLTPREARRLGREQSRIGRAESRAEADGTLTPREARRLEARQDAASRHIRRQKHDAQVRPMP